MIYFTHIINPFQPNKGRVSCALEKEHTVWDIVKSQHIDLSKPTICLINGVAQLRKCWNDIQRKNRVIPVEVKATTNLRTKSLKVYCDKYKPEQAIRTSLADYKQTEILYDIPLYCIEDIDAILENGQQNS